jgi:hypothetical protein
MNSKTVRFIFFLFARDTIDGPPCDAPLLSLCHTDICAISAWRTMPSRNCHFPRQSVTLHAQRPLPPYLCSYSPFPHLTSISLLASYLLEAILVQLIFHVAHVKTNRKKRVNTMFTSMQRKGTNQVRVQNRKP